MVRDITGKGGFQEQVALYSNDLNANVDLADDPNEIFYYDFADSESLDNINAILDGLMAKVPDMSAKLTEDKQHMETIYICWIIRHPYGLQQELSVVLLMRDEVVALMVDWILQPM